MEFEERSRPNKSAAKRAAQEVEALAEQLAGAADTVLAGLELPEDLQQEVALVRRTSAHGARKRQVKHLAALLRQRPEETAAIREHLLGQSERHWQEQKVFHELEGWRDRLCDPERAAAALTELAERSPGLDIRELERLSRAACHGDKASARQIFRRLRAAPPR